MERNKFSNRFLSLEFHEISIFNKQKNKPLSFKTKKFQLLKVKDYHLRGYIFTWKDLSYLETKKNRTKTKFVTP